MASSAPPEDEYEVLEKVGEGTYGMVFKARGSCGGVFALKRIRKELEAEGIPSTTIREISLLKELDHPNIVKLCDVVYKHNQLTLVLEFLDLDLKKLLDRSPKGLKPTEIRWFLQQLLAGVAFCHKNRILHRDLKPQNLLINKSGDLKLGDFGLARAFGIPVKSHTHEVVTLWYRSPDMLLGSVDQITSIDMWSVGCIFAEMASGRPLFPGTSPFDQLNRILRLVGTPTTQECAKLIKRDVKIQLPFYAGGTWSALLPQLDEAALDLLQRMLKFDPALRIAASQALEHRYFDVMPKSYADACGK
eukprot:CAMPEP_0113847020 /NCGR_PEP_ID=MMETSP0372-20130328/1633_1 /TAXON_ID=340204 /ORGANISM="Lankesteria abbotti" /LENGTH=303 /DNA_ID=CAMNT_0000816233 /DNA_START=119 /DNA_END=1030 /DNA_ORIENTATION=+ /assembly_acc=CAM_ASM_000359